MASLKLLWLTGVNCDWLFLPVTNADSYMIKSGQTLKGIFPAPNSCNMPFSMLLMECIIASMVRWVSGLC